MQLGDWWKASLVRRNDQSSQSDFAWRLHIEPKVLRQNKRGKSLLEKWPALGEWGGGSHLRALSLYRRTLLATMEIESISEQQDPLLPKCGSHRFAGNS